MRVGEWKGELLVALVPSGGKTCGYGTIWHYNLAIILLLIVGNRDDEPMV